MLFKITQKFIDKFREQMLAGTLSDEGIESLHIETLITEGTEAPDSMSIMLDFVSAIAPQMQAEILHALVSKLVTAEFARKDSFMRSSCIAKYFLAYQACYYPSQVDLLLNDDRLKAALFSPTFNEEKKRNTLDKFHYIILGSSQVSLLLHMAKIKAISSPMHAKKIENLESTRTTAYRALASSPINPEPIKKFIASLIKFNDSLNSPSNTTYLEVLPEVESNIPAVGRASAVGLFRRVYRSISSSIGNSPRVSEVVLSRASDELSSRPGSSASTTMPSLQHGVSAQSLFSDSAVASSPPQENKRKSSSPWTMAV